MIIMDVLESMLAEAAALSTGSTSPFDLEEAVTALTTAGVITCTFFVLFKYLKLFANIIVILSLVS